MFQNVRIYGVQCLDHAEAGTFWRDVAALTGGNLTEETRQKLHELAQKA